MRTRIAGACAVLLLLAPAAQAEDSAAEDAIGFSSRVGLNGFGEMVDARIPETLNIRGGLRYRFQIVERSFTRTTDLTRNEQTHQIMLYGGVSILGLVDVAATLPYEWERIENNFQNGFGNDSTDNENGWGDLEAAAKLSIELGPIDFAPYARGRFPTAESQVEDLAEAEWGVAGTFSIFNEYLSLNGNLAGITKETEGVEGITYRLGASFVVWADEIALVRIWGFGGGKTFEDKADTDIDLSFGIQARVFEFITIEVASSVKVLDGGNLDELEEEELQTLGVFDDRFDDEGSWDVTASVGFMF